MSLVEPANSIADSLYNTGLVWLGRWDDLSEISSYVASLDLDSGLLTPGTAYAGQMISLICVFSTLREGWDFSYRFLTDFLPG